jgi:glutamate--cysteine ligase regulatory subunit
MEDFKGAGLVSSLGISEFGILRLKAFLPWVRIRPSVDQINLRDVCDVPRDLLDFAKSEAIKLIPHMDEDNPLSKSALQDILNDLGVAEHVRQMRWIVKYTAVVKARGVVDNKGYTL